MELTDLHKNLVRQLKEDTGYGMMDCKKSLIMNNWNINNAKKWLVENEKESEFVRLITKRFINNFDETKWRI